MKTDKMTLKDAIQKVIDAHREPLSPEQIKQSLGFYGFGDASINNICTRLPEIARDPRYHIKAYPKQGVKGQWYNLWGNLPSMNGQNEAQRELF